MVSVNSLATCEILAPKMGRRAHRTNIVRSLKGLEDIIQLAVMDFELTDKGWVFNGNDGSDKRDPLYGFEYIRELYWKADPDYNMRCMLLN